MFEVVFLGTSASTPSAFRGLSAHIIMHRHYRFLLDCGEGTQQQILRSGLGFKRLDKVLLTHGHLDHILGLGGLVSTLSRWETLDVLEIYGGTSALARVSDLIFGVVLRGNKPDAEIRLIPLEPDMVIMEDEKFTLTAFPVTHRGPDCFGFAFQEKARRPFLADRADALGVPFGPERAELVRGRPITLGDGRVVHPDDVLGAEIPGTRYIHIGDTGRTDNLRDVCRDAHGLTIEATYTEEEADMARKFGHLTAAQGAALARDVGVRGLILTHLSRRHAEKDIKREARAIFPRTYVARDLDHYRITRDGIERVRKES